MSAFNRGRASKQKLGGLSNGGVRLVEKYCPLLVLCHLRRM